MATTTIPSFSNYSSTISPSDQNYGFSITSPGNVRVAVFTGAQGLYYSLIQNNVWRTPTSINRTFNISPNNTQFICCSITATGGRLIVSAGTYDTANAWIYWADASGLLNTTSSTLSFTRISDINQRTYNMSSISDDGSRLVISSKNGYVYFTNWNGSNYNALTPILDTTISTYIGVAISSDGTRLAYTRSNITYWSVWNGTNFSIGTAISGNTNGTNNRGISFYRGNTTFLLSASQNGQPQYTLWNGTGYDAWKNMPVTALPNDKDGWGLLVDSSGNVYLSPFGENKVYISQVALTLPIFSLSFGNSTTPLTTQTTGNLGFAVSSPGNQRLAVFTSMGGIYYSRILGGVWGAFISTSRTFNVNPSGTDFIACAMTPSANRLVVSVGTFGTNNHFLYWCNPTALLNGTNSNLSFTRILDTTTSRGYYFASITTDGNRLLVSSAQGIFMSTWNGTNYSSLTTIISGTTFGGITVSNDGNRLAFVDNVSLKWGVWDGNTYGTFTTITGTINQAYGARSLSFLGNTVGNNTDMIISTPGGGQAQYTLWNGVSYGSLTNISTTSLPIVNGWGLSIDISGTIFLAPYGTANVYMCVPTFIRTPLLASSTPVLYSSNMFTSDTLTVSGQSPIYRNGTYITSASSVYNNNIAQAGAWLAFNLSTVTNLTLGTFWHSNALVYNVTTGAYASNKVTTNIVGSSGISGEWIQIQLPYRLLVKSVGMAARQFSSAQIARLPVSMVILGSNNGTTWNILYSQTAPPTAYSSSVVNTIPISGVTVAYSYFRLIARTVGIASNGNTVNIQQLNYSGDIYLYRYPEKPTITSIFPLNQQLGVNYSAFTLPDDNLIVNYTYSLNGGSDVSFNSFLSPLIISDLSNGTNYNVNMKSFNNFGFSAVSNTISMAPATIPTAPTINFLVSGVQQISVDFTPPLSDGYSTILYYNYSLNGGADISTNTVSSPIIITGLVGGTTYSVKISAVNSMGVSPYSNILSSIPVSVPTAPTLNYLISSNQQITVYFNGSSSDGGSTILYYSYSLNGGNDISTNSITSPILIENLTNGISYSVRIRAVNSIGSSPYSNILLGMPYNAPPRPIIDYILVEPKTLFVFFSSISGSVISGVQYSINGSNYIDASNSTSPIFIQNITEGVLYSVSIKTINNLGTSVSSDVYSVYMPIINSNTIPTSVDVCGNIFTITSKDISTNVLYYKYSLDGINWNTNSASNLIDTTQSDGVSLVGNNYIAPPNTTNKIAFRIIAPSFPINNYNTKDKMYNLDSSGNNIKSVITVPINNITMKGMILLPHKSL